jgi:hypothetical protein
MKGKKINEDIVGDLLPILIPLTAYIAHLGLKLLGFSRNAWDGAGLSKEVQTALPFIYKDTALIKDFAKILKDEGDLEQFFKKIDTANEKIWKNQVGVIGGPGRFDWNHIGFVKNYKFQPDAKRVANKLIKTNSYKRFSKKYSLSNEDDVMMEKLFYWIVTRPNFKDEVKQYILNVVDASTNQKTIKLKDLIPPRLVG